MKKNVLLHTNFLVCIIIIIGFVATAYLSYQSNQDIFRKDVENVATLTSEGIYHQIDSIFSKPINISLTMANDHLLKEFLAGEQEHVNDDWFIEQMRKYLNDYRVKYDYDSVFLASAQTQRYYYYNGLDRTLPPDNPENVWFYEFLSSGEEYSLNIDNDEVQAASNDITVFINSRINGDDGQTVGIVGVGFRVDYMQALFADYEDKYNLRAYLINKNGTVELSTNETGYKAVNLFDESVYPELKDEIFSAANDSRTLWYSEKQRSGYIVSQYIPNLEWYLIVDYDTTELNQTLSYQLTRQFLIIAVIIITVLAVITGVIRKYRAKIIELTVAREQEHRTVFQKAAEQLYEDIYEVDITHNRAASEATIKYFESLGAPSNAPYDQALNIIAQKQIKEEFREGYINTFSPESVLEAYKNGAESLRYDFMISVDGVNYYWMRITAQIFFWTEDDSVRMLVYRQNIDAEKRREEYLYDQMQKDSLTGLYNKAATQERIRAMLEKTPGGSFAFFILDIDYFKTVNDKLGHAMGDSVLIEFAKAIKKQFRDEDIVGRIGGDEFVAFVPVPSVEHVVKKARDLVNTLHRKIYMDSTHYCEISASIGAAISPEAGSDFDTLYKRADEALYKTKEKNKNGFTIYKKEK